MLTIAIVGHVSNEGASATFSRYHQSSTHKIPPLILFSLPTKPVLKAPFLALKLKMREANAEKAANQDPSSPA